MDQGVSDEAIVVIKQTANENVATHLRIKLFVRDRMLKAKGGTCNQTDRPIMNHHFEAREKKLSSTLKSTYRQTKI